MISKLIFAGYTGSKNQVRTRKKIKFDSKSIFFWVCNKLPNWHFKNQAQIDTTKVSISRMQCVGLLNSSKKRTKLTILSIFSEYLVSFVHFWTNRGHNSLLSRLSDLYLRPRFHFADFLWTFPVKNSIQKSSWLHLIFPDFYIEFKKGSEGATVLSLTLKSKRFTNTLPHKLVHRILWPPGGLQFPNWLRSRFFLIACANARYPGFWKEVIKHSF